MSSFNASAWALEHKSFVGFLIVLLALAGLLSYERLGRDEDPPFTIKVMVVRAVWPGATAEDTAREVTDRMEKALQSLQWIDYISSYTKPGEATLMVQLKDQTPPAAVPDQWYQVRKKIADMRQSLPLGTQGPFFNDEFGDVYAVIYEGWLYNVYIPSGYLMYEHWLIPAVSSEDDNCREFWQSGNQERPKCSQNLQTCLPL